MLIFTAYRAYEPIECKYVWHLKHEAREVEKDFASEIALNCKRLHNILHSLLHLLQPGLSSVPVYL